MFGLPVGKLRKYQVLRSNGLNIQRSSKLARMMSTSSGASKYLKVRLETQVHALSYKAVKLLKCKIWTSEGQVLGYAKLVVSFMWPVA